MSEWTGEITNIVQRQLVPVTKWELQEAVSLMDDQEDCDWKVIATYDTKEEGWAAMRGGDSYQPKESE